MNLNNEYKVFVGGFPVELNQKCLHEYMSKFGKVVYVKLHMKGSRKSKGYAFVEFDQLSSVDRVVSLSHSLNGRSVRFTHSPPEWSI